MEQRGNAPETGASFFGGLDRDFKKRCAELAGPENGASFFFAKIHKNFFEKKAKILIKKFAREKKI